MQTLEIRVNGLSPILMHSDKLANPLDPLKKLQAQYTSKRKKTDDDHAEISKIEWMSAMYYDEKIGPFLPGRMLKANLIVAAKKTKESPKVKSGLIVSTDKAKLQYNGPRNQEEMWKSGDFADVRSVVVQRARLMRCRPIFNEWCAEFEIVYDENIIDGGDVVRLLETGGTMIGLGDYRPAKGGDFGRFEVEVLHGEK